MPKKKKVEAKEAEVVTAPKEVVSPLRVAEDDKAVFNIVRPLVTPQQAKSAWKAYQELCNALLEPSDFTIINVFVRGAGMIGKPFKNKSAWRKLATAFNLSDEVVKEERVEYPEMEYVDKETKIPYKKSGFIIKITARVVALNGRYTEAVGVCASNERGFAHVEHDVRATAHTRAKSRAISDMIGGGETTAEEIAEMKKKKTDECPQDHTKLEQKIVSTEGKNKGRPYVKCPSCTYFEWLGEAPAEN